MAFSPIGDSLLVLLVVLLGFGSTLLSATQSEDMSCSDHNQTFDHLYSTCCTRCPPGQGVALPCKSSNDTVCEPCRKGHEFSAVDSHTEHCKPCYQCPTNSHRVHECNETHDTRCKCNSGFYGSALGSGGEQFRCKRCTQCRPGQYRARVCESRRDTVCEKCPSGYFSARANALHCSPCSSCSLQESVVRKCSPQQDTLCSDSPLVDDQTPSENYFTDGSNLIPVYCTLFGLLFIGLVIYVILKRWNLCPRKPPLKASQGQLLPPPQPNIYLEQNGRWSPKKPLPTAESQQKLLSVQTVPTSSKISENCLQSLESRIVAESGTDARQLWVALANRLGYGAELPTIQRQATLQQVSEIRALLDRWNGDNRGSDVSSLIKALQQSGRQDLAELLCKQEPAIINI